MWNMLLKFENYLTPDDKNPHDNVVNEDVIIAFLQFILAWLVQWDEQKQHDHIRDGHRAINRQLIESMQKTVDLGIQLIQTQNNKTELLYLWATKNTRIFWPLILQPIHVNRLTVHSAKIEIPYDGKISADDVFTSFDIIEPQQLKMTVQDIDLLRNVLQYIAQKDITCCHNYINTLTSNHYRLCSLQTIKYSSKRKYFALKNDGPLIFALLEALQIMPNLPFDAVSPQTADVLLHDPNFEFREPFLVFSVTDETGNRTYEINLPGDFETLTYVWRG